MIRIPFYSNSEDSLPIRRIVQRVARSLGMSPFTVGIALSHFLEGLAVELACGKCVKIAGFGAFGVVRFDPPGDTPAYAAVRFSASRALRNEVAMSASPSPTSEHDFWRYARHHKRSRRPDKKRSTTFTAMRAFRADLEAQARRLGVNPYETGS